MAQTIKLKRSSNSGSSGIPSTSQLALGEVGINTYHGKLYIKKNDGNDAIIEVSADKLPLTGGTLTGNLSLGDNVKAQFGASDDLQIYHDGTHSYISDVGTGDLRLSANNLRMQNADNTANYIKANNGSNVELYFNNSAKLSTTSTGINVTGTITSGAITSSSDVTADTHFTSSDSNATLSSSGTGGNVYLRPNGKSSTSGQAHIVANGDATFSGNIAAADGSVSSPSYTFSGRTNTGLYASDDWTGSADQLHFVVDGTLRGYVNNAGITSEDNIYIAGNGSFRNYTDHWIASTGTAGKHFYFKNNTNNVLLDITSDGETTFSNKSLGIGFITLQNVKNEAANQYVRGSIIFSRDDGQISWDSTNDQWTHAGGSSTDWSMIAHDSSYLSIYSGPAVTSATNYTHTAFKDNFARLAIEHSTGKIGIGTRAPTSTVDIRGANGVTHSRGQLYLSNTETAAINKGSQISLGGTYSGTGDSYFASIAGRKENGTSGDYDGYLQLATRLNGGSNTERMRITSGGLVGIGTTTPDTKLDVENNANSTTTIRINNATGGTAARANLRMLSDSAQFDLYATSSSYTGVTGWADSGILSTGSTASAGLILNAQAGGIKFQYGTTTKALIDTSGRFLINATTTSFSDKLYVNGDAYVTGGWRVGSGATYTGKIYNNAGKMSFETDSNRDIQFGDSGTPAIMYIDTSTEKVGIGTTTPDRKLHISGSGGTVAFKAEATDTSQASLDLKTSNSWFRMISSSGRLSFYDQADSAERMRIDTSGIVTINNTGEQGWSGNNLNVGDTGDGSSGINILTTTTGNGYILFSDVVDNSATEYDNQIRFSHTDNFLGFSIGGTERLRITSTGNVGIGTTSPDSTLHLKSTGDTRMTIESPDANDAYINFSGATNEMSLGYDKSDSAMYITNHGTLTANRRVTIKTDGNVGIGTTNPKAALQIKEYGIDTTTTATSATTQVTVDTFPIADFRTARYTIQITNTTDSTYHTTEILLIHDGSTAHITEYATIFTGAAAEATFTADISSSNVRLRATPESTNSRSFKVVRHSITV